MTYPPPHFITNPAILGFSKFLRKQKSFSARQNSFLLTELSLLLCHAFRVPRCDLLASVLPVLRSFDLTDVPNSTLLQILLYGDKKLPFEVNKSILQATIMYILRTERLT